MPGKESCVVYQLKVVLRDIHPPIWRRIQVWEDATLAQLHRVLQIALGWEDSHLHQFTIGVRTFSEPEPDDEVDQRTVNDERKVRLREVISAVGTTFDYEYDFGDGWQHLLLLEAVLEPEPGALYPRCLAGERSAPPEDVGGPPGYENYLRAITDPVHEEHEDMLQWRGPFDPESFSLDPINRQLEKKFHSARKKAIFLPKLRESRTAQDLQGALARLEHAALAARGLAPKVRKRIRPTDTVPVELSARERQLILENSFAEPELTDRLRVVPSPSAPLVYSFTLDELDELVGYIAAEANHAKDKQLQKVWERLFGRLSSLLESHTDDGA